MRSIKQYYIAILAALISKILIFVVISLFSMQIFSNQRTGLSVWELWNVWDVPHYISIAASGYQNKGVEANFIVFLPLLPLLIFISKMIFQTSFLISGYIVSFFAMSFWLSLPHYIINLFPMFIVLALFSKNVLFRYFWLLSSVILLVILGSIFIQYGPVF